MRARLLTLLLTLVSIAFALFVVEMGLRIQGHVPLLSTDNFVARAIDNVRQPGLVVHDPQLGWVQAPHQRQRYGQGRSDSYTTGDLGERMPGPQVRPLRQGVILAIGDSFTAGAEVSDDEAWPAQLETMLRTEVINAGVLGYGVDQIVLRAEDLVPRLRPKFLLVGILAVDSFRNPSSVYGGAPKPYFAIENGALALRNVPVPRLASSAREIGRLRSVLARSYLVHFTMMRLAPSWWVASTLQTRAVSTNEEAVPISCLLMRRLAQLRDRYDVHVGIIVLYGGPEGLAADPPWYGRSLVDCAAKAGLDVTADFDMLKSVREQQGMDAYHSLWVMHDDNRSYGHMSPEGNRLLASLIADSFFEVGAVPSPAGNPQDLR